MSAKRPPPRIRRNPRDEIATSGVDGGVRMKVGADLFVSSGRDEARATFSAGSRTVSWVMSETVKQSENRPRRSNQKWFTPSSVTLIIKIDVRVVMT